MSWISKHIPHLMATLRRRKTHMMSMALGSMNATTCVWCGVSASSFFIGGAQSFPTTILLEEAALLLKYKTRAQRENRQGVSGCSARKHCHQILNVVHLFGEDASDHWDNLVAASSEFCDEQLSMGGPKKEHLEVVELDHLQVFGEGHLFLFKYCSQF